MEAESFKMLVRTLKSTPALLLAVCVVLTSCETTKYLPRSHLPNAFLEVFEPCSPRSGSYDLESRGILGSGSTPGVGLAFEAGQGSVAMELAGEFGPALLAMRSNGSSLSRDGLMAELAKPLSLNKDGRILYKGYFSGLRIDEIGCIISGKLPASWMANIVSYKKGGSNEHVSIKHDGRNIHLVMNQLAEPSQRSFCARVDWRVAAGLFKPEVEWCHGAPGSKLKLPGGHHSQLKVEKKAIFWSPI
jgi:hypothetical protein